MDEQKVIILSDTHMPNKSKKLPGKLNFELEHADLIIHLGDWQTAELYYELNRYAPVEGVAGNVDNDEIVRILGFEKIISLNGINIGLTHGHLGKGRSTPIRALNTFKYQNVNIILFGHSHIPINETANGITLFNPGSPTDKRRQSHFSYGILNISHHNFSIHHRFFTSNE
ncbi:YfcE family phosphodiesterase [Bacillus salitolerans]|uniref:Phosphoesterase n=1 Tax=Bacillus salitolerans TaxID=1437434 RepID=A0ABW4LJT6_9BACI